MVLLGGRATGPQEQLQGGVAAHVLVVGVPSGELASDGFIGQQEVCGRPHKHLGGRTCKLHSVLGEHADVMASVYSDYQQIPIAMYYCTLNFIEMTRLLRPEKRLLNA